jgi:hypothetical protein
MLVFKDNITNVYFKFVGIPFTNLLYTHHANSSPAKLTPMGKKSDQMFFQMVTLSCFISVIMGMGFNVGAKGFAPLITSRTLTSVNRCKCDKNQSIATATTASTATFRLPHVSL